MLHGAGIFTYNIWWFLGYCIPAPMEHIGIWLFSGSILLMVLPNQSSWQRGLSTCSATKSVELALHSKKIIQSYTWSLFSMLPWGKLTQMWKTNGVRFGKLCTNLVWWVKTTSLSRPYRRVLIQEGSQRKCSCLVSDVLSTCPTLLMPHEQCSKYWVVDRNCQSRLVESPMYVYYVYIYIIIYIFTYDYIYIYRLHMYTLTILDTKKQTMLVSRYSYG